jgi:hypothetical protein
MQLLLAVLILGTLLRVTQGEMSEPFSCRSSCFISDFAPGPANVTDQRNFSGCMLQIKSPSPYYNYVFKSNL